MDRYPREQTDDDQLPSGTTLASGKIDVDTNAPVTAKEEQRFPTSFWFWELMATLASAVCMLAVVIILELMRNKPLMHWAFPLSLNATVAVFITIAKSMSLLVIGACIAQSKWARFKSSAIRLREFDFFDDAARGPLGSLILLSRVRWGLASIGALATILAPGVDIFAQQVVRFDTRIIETLGGYEPSFSLSHAYLGGANWSYPNPVVQEDSVDVAMQGAVFRGIYNVPTIPDFRCAHNCTWKETYASLGFASKCRNVTESTLITMAVSEVPSDDDWGWTWLNMTTPGNIGLKIKLSEQYQTRIQVVANATNRLQDLYNTRDRVVSPELVRVGVIRRRPDIKKGLFGEEKEELKDYIKELEVFDCAIGLTVYNYTAINASGNDITFTREPIDLPPGILHDPASDNIKFTRDGLPAFYANPADIAALGDLFESSRFTGNMTSGEIPMDAATGVVVALLKSNISQIFSNLADSMTEQLRTRPDVVAEGVILVNEVFVRIQWVWLILPFVITITAALFLIATCIESWAQGCIPLKSSSVALLYHEVGLHGDDQVVLESAMSSLGEMKKAAHRTKVRLSTAW